jgi:hypothetical protein
MEIKAQKTNIGTCNTKTSFSFVQPRLLSSVQIETERLTKNKYVRRIKALHQQNEKANRMDKNA